ncbi:MAG TPA: O-antigen ligase family protein [Anaerolineae bacterium]|nr:O-antigen ligase family protein [Anaerolineae bacterium]HQI83934.1 O-antigen ligase family protein [Anaerolineae bacterium]
MTNWRTTIQDLLENSVLRPLIFSRRRWLLVAIAVLLVAGVSIGGGWLIVEVGALPALALLIALGLFAWIVRDIEIAYAGVIGIITLLPFASLPFSIGFKPTFLDLALGGLFLVWLIPYLLGEEQRFDATPLGALVLVFAFLAVGTFVVGLGHAALTVTLVRRFAETLLSLALFYLVVNTVRDGGRLGRLMRWLILGATGAAFLGIVLYFLPDLLTIRLLSALGRLGYPTGMGVLRYIRDDPSLMQRATSTSIDPNVLGSLLNLALAMTVPQLFAKRPLLPRWLIVVCIGVMGICLGLTISRGSMVAVALAILVVSVLRYRKLLPWFAAALLLVLILPWTQSYIGHFIEGVQLQDLSMKMRLGEYKDAFILIGRYPLLGVGFAGAPDIDIYTAVASVYLTIAERMGLIGLAVFLVIAAVLLVRFWRWRKVAEASPELEPLWYGIHAAIIGGLIAGLSDRYFFSLDFHHSVTLFWLIVGLATAAVQIATASTSVNRKT